MKPELRYRTLWLVAGYILVGIIIYLSVTAEPPDLGLRVPFMDKISHVLAYFVLMGWFGQIYHVNRQRFFYAGAFVLMGIALEYIQSLGVARFFEVADMMANTLGVGLAVLLSMYTGFRFLLHRLEACFVR